MSPEKKTIFTFTYIPSENGAIIKANNNPICIKDTEIIVCEKNKKPEFVRIKKKNGLRIKTAIPKIFEFKKCFGITENKLSFTKCIDETLDKIWFFVDSNYANLNGNDTIFDNSNLIIDSSSESSNKNENSKTKNKLNVNKNIMGEDNLTSSYPYFNCIPDSNVQQNSIFPSSYKQIYIPSGSFLRIPPNTLEKTNNCNTSYTNTSPFLQPSINTFKDCSSYYNNLNNHYQQLIQKQNELKMTMESATPSCDLINQNEKSKPVITVKPTISNQIFDKTHLNVPTENNKSIDWNVPTENNKSIGWNVPTKYNKSIDWNVPTENNKSIDWNIPTEYNKSIGWNVPTDTMLR